jgi:serine/threonine-protein kinase
MPDDDRTMVGSPAVTDPTDDEDDERRDSRTGLWVLLALLLVLLIGGAAYLLPRMFESPPEQERVPDVIGMREDDARAELGAAGFTVEVEFRTDPGGRQGQVLEQDPNADQYVEPGSEVTIVVSEGKPLAEVPFVLDQPRSAARERLESEGFDVVMTERESDEPKDQVVATDRSPGDSVPEGSTVTVFYSDGPEKVPGVIGDQQEDAERTLREAGFEVDVVPTTDTTEPKGTVVDQSPDPGDEAQSGATVTIVVSQFEEPTETPSEEPSPTETPGLPTETPAVATDPSRPVRQSGQRMGSA